MTPAVRQGLRYVNTIRHLRFEQIVGRARVKLRRVVPDARPAPPLRMQTGRWVAPIPHPPSLQPGFHVRFLNEDGEIEHANQWNNPNKAKLWLYNLHYFDVLNAEDGGKRRPLQRALISRWITENPPPAGNGWEPYPVSLRIVNWIKWALAGETLDAEMHQSLAMQIRWLTFHIEWHLLGNHLLANAKALLFAGLYFDGPEAQGWLETGLAIYERELPEQILHDGAHFELSPMYHAVILEDLLDLINMARLYGRYSVAAFCGLPERTRRMRSWLAAMTHPDGELSFFNDAAIGIASSRDDLESYAERLDLGAVTGPGEGVHHLQASGYIRINRGKMAAIIDVAAIGPDYLPGHAHADTLSFELSLGGERLIVNGGTSTYAPGARREVERSTAAHSTVEIAGDSSSEVWSSFRVARRAKVESVAIKDSGENIEITASHNGYSRLRGRPTHHRRWRVSPGGLKIEDRIVGNKIPKSISRFHLGDRVLAKADETSRHGVLTTATGQKVRWTASEPVEIVNSAWAREFGRRLPIETLSAQLRSGCLDLELEWCG